MDVKQVSAWSKWTGRIGTLVSILLLMAVLDGLVSRFRTPLDHFSSLPGSRKAVSGPLPEKSEHPGELTYRSNSKDIQVVFEAVQTGFWLGGYLWSGTLSLGPGIEPGGYLLTVQSKKGQGERSASLFHIEAYRDLTSLQKDSKSFFLRTLGISPWRAALFFIPFIMATFGVVFFLSYKIEILLAEQGEAEVYRIRKEQDGFEIFFGLGSKQGIRPGTGLTLINKQGGPVASITAREVFEGYSTALVDPELNVRPGFMIRL